MPMWSSVANLKESLSKIALDVHEDDDEELSIYTSPSRDRLENGNSGSDRRFSSNFTRSIPPAHSPIVNGFNSPSNHEIEQYETEIKRLQESESEIKALSVNYAALLKEKESQISRLAEENGSLKQNLLTTNAALTASKTVVKGGDDISPNRHNKAVVKSRMAGSLLINGTAPKYDGMNNGISSDDVKELSDMVEDKNRSLAMLQATHEAQMKQLMIELDEERKKSSSLHIKLQEEQKLRASFQQELTSLRDDNDKMVKEMHKTRNELNEKISEIGQLQMVSQKREGDVTNARIDNLKGVIATLENQNKYLKKEKDETEAALKVIRSSPGHKDIPGEVDPSNKHSSQVNEVFPGKEEMQKSLQKLQKDLKDALREKDKALQGLNRLKQHLLEKESEESEKMDEDSKIIEELRETNEHQKIQLSRLDKALKQAIRDQEETKSSNNDELKKSKETVDELSRKLASYTNIIDAKNMEVLNLQTALGQYYAEIEAKERLGEELSVAKEESARLSVQLKEAHQKAEVSKGEKVEILGKLSEAERMLVEGKNRVKKLEEDNEKLRRALEQSMTRLNRMSVDSDFLVDRRIVIKLLVTYFQRNHSKEVLELMVRMLGFSEEDKQRIGVAQQGTGRGLVRGVLGFPGRLVGGIVGGSAETSMNMPPDDQSFADLWVDFLLTETEREKKEALAAANASNQDQKHKGSPNVIESSYPSPDYTRAKIIPNISSPSPYLNQDQSPSSSHGIFLRRDSSDSEFSTVPLYSSGGGSQSSRPLPRY